MSFEDEEYKKGRKYGEKLRTNMFSKFDAIYMSAQCLNRVKEVEIKQKVKRGKKIRVAFLIETISMFTCANIYKEMEKKDDIFYPFVILYKGLAWELKDGQIEEHEILLSKLERLGYRVFSGYDEKYFFNPLLNFFPDIVFVSALFLDNTFSSLLSNTVLNIQFLVCQLNYGFRVKNGYVYQYNNRVFNLAWRHFVETKMDFWELRKYSSTLGANALPTGSPILDDYAKPLQDCRIPKKIDNGKPIVIYAPHWSLKVNSLDTGTFDIYYEKFLDMAKSNPDINFIFKPHPALEARLIYLKIMTHEIFQNYLDRWDTLPNAICEFGYNYIDLFRRSSLLITDCASFIFSWLPTTKACIYPVMDFTNKKGFENKFTINARTILGTYYICDNWEKIEKIFTDIIYKIDTNKREKMKEATRKLLSEKIFFNIGNASKTIVDYVENVFTI